MVAIDIHDDCGGTSVSIIIAVLEGIVTCSDLFPCRELLCFYTNHKTPQFLPSIFLRNFYK